MLLLCGEGRQQLVVFSGRIFAAAVNRLVINIERGPLNILHIQVAWKGVRS